MAYGQNASSRDAFTTFMVSILQVLLKKSLEIKFYFLKKRDNITIDSMQ